MKEAIEALVQNAISQSGLPISPGLLWHGSDEYTLGFSGRRIEGLPENFFAQVYICGKEIEMGFLIEIGTFGYDLTTRDGFSRLYWARTVSSHDLETGGELLTEEIKDAITKAWNNLPVLYQKALEEKEELLRIFKQLQKDGKLRE